MTEPAGAGALVGARQLPVTPGRGEREREDEQPRREAEDGGGTTVGGEKAG